MMFCNYSGRSPAVTGVIGPGEARLRDVAQDCLGEGMEEIGALLEHGVEIEADGAEGIEAGLGAEAAGGFLLDLRQAHDLFGGIIREGDVLIGSETPDIVGVDAQAVDQVERLALLGPPALAREGGARGLAASPSVRMVS